MIEGNGYRPSHRGNGFRESEEMYSLNTTEVHAVCYILLDHHIPRVTTIAKDQRNIQTLIGRGGTGGGNVPLIMVEKSQNESILRETDESICPRKEKG